MQIEFERERAASVNVENGERRQWLVVVAVNTTRRRPNILQPVDLEHPICPQ